MRCGGNGTRYDREAQDTIGVTQAGSRQDTKRQGESGKVQDDQDETRRTAAGPCMPSVRPAIPVVELMPSGVASPCFCVAASKAASALAFGIGMGQTGEQGRGEFFEGDFFERIGVGQDGGLLVAARDVEAARGDVLRAV